MKEMKEMKRNEKKRNVWRDNANAQNDDCPAVFYHTLQTWAVNWSLEMTSLSMSIAAAPCPIRQSLSISPNRNPPSLDLPSVGCRVNTARGPLCEELKCFIVFYCVLLCFIALLFCLKWKQTWLWHASCPRPCVWAFDKTLDQNKCKHWEVFQ